jgi:hypothetical protein
MAACHMTMAMHSIAVHGQPAHHLSFAVDFMVIATGYVLPRGFIASVIGASAAPGLALHTYCCM